jgi:DNA-binding NarL/FixJ family response regulator
MAKQVNSRVLIVDAEPITRFGLMHLIQGQKNLCVCGDADNLPVARDWCEKEKPDLVIVDPSMGDGFGFIKDVPRWSSNTRVVVLTTLEDALSVQRAFQAGASGYVTRRDPLPALLLSIEGALKGERHMGPRVEHVMLNTLACGGLELRDNMEAGLSNREREVLRLLGLGQSTREVAHELRVSVKTVETHGKRIKDKLNLSGSSALRRHAALYASHHGNGNGVHKAAESDLKGE